jgi:hypothetical protein
MKKRIPVLLLSAGLLLFISGCASPEGRPFVKRSDKVEKIVLRTRGEAGQHFSAKLNIDGRNWEVTGVSPVEYSLETCLLTGTLRKTSGDGTLRFEIKGSGATLGFGALEEPGQSCRFRYHANGIEVW